MNRFIWVVASLAFVAAAFLAARGTALTGTEGVIAFGGGFSWG
ncbi:hypothetical protein [Streptosporangium subroseum]|nr:hypothetical protein OHB15_01880 [Streptosporangium subroseum]